MYIDVFDVFLFEVGESIESWTEEALELNGFELNRTAALNGLMRIV